MSKAMLALVFSNGKMYEGSEGLMYDGPGPKVLNIQRGISLDSLKQRIHSKLKLHANQVVSTVIYRFPVWCNVLKFIALKLEDDEDVVCMFDSYEQQPNLTSMDLYVEIEDSPGNFDQNGAIENEGLSACGLSLESEAPPVREELLDTTQNEGAVPDGSNDDCSNSDVDGGFDADVNLQKEGPLGETVGARDLSLAMVVSPVSYMPPLGETSGSKEHVPPSQRMNPGPDDPSLLTLQSVHCSQHIWNGEADRVLRVRRAQKKGNDLLDAIIPYLKQAGFYGVACLGFIQMDHHLITAFVERWRPETHTFHLPQGECTITLQDVSILMGLSVDGLPITGLTLDDWAGLCGRLLGVIPPPTALYGGRLNMSWLDDQFRELPENASEVTVQQFARAYILRLIGGVLFVDKSSRFVHLVYLPLLEDFQVAGTYSWGSACLAFLYREMCKASDYDVKEIGGACLLLQLWVWERFPLLSPKKLGLVVHDRSPSGEEYGRALPGPLGCRWQRCKGIPELSSHALSQYRLQLDRLKAREAKWHQPDRVLRQFGLCQPIPRHPFQPPHLHDVSLRGRHDVNWQQEHRQYISLWQNRRNQVIKGELFNGHLNANSEYMRWYWRVTRRWISPVGAVPAVVVHSVEMMHTWSTPQGRHSFSFDNLQKSCREILGALDEHDRISTCWSEPAPPAEDIPGPSGDDYQRHGQQKQKGHGVAAKRRRVETPATTDMPLAPTRGRGRPKGSTAVRAVGRNSTGVTVDDASSDKPEVPSASNAS
ncbi:serine/threonine-protein phosphatase 7 long form-like protein [Senna tora]|uniref:Serine/threonine-protein phosphatase 7 long form-like protein n=1 Tax=Senna tora TaxID=362788 RepID=A0A834WW38_9FABA|nr:serine/threonine-protein phosphatase 7 long form-like protein [Senna tora]